MIRQEAEKILKEAVGKKVELERPSDPDFGDFSTNIALREKMDPEEIIKKVKRNSLFEKIEKKGPGFINFTLSKECLTEELKKILKEKDKYGDLKIGKRKKIQVEFISANPTGPLTVASAVSGPYGDTLANIFKKAGFKAEKAYYINDHGHQVEVLGHSVLGDEKAEYKGEYIEELKKRIKGDDAQRTGYLAAGEILAGIRKTAEKMGINYDEWISETKLYESGRVDEVLKLLEQNGFIYEKDGAKWFKSTQFGDNRDRVVVKQDGQKTYLAGDLALHDYKFKDRKFNQVINIWGADHHGDVAGVMAGVEALGYKGKLQIILHQMITIMEKGEKKKMSKRSGIYVLLDDLIKEVGKDAIRFFFLQKSIGAHLIFDLDLAKEQSSKNPVYYVQYAHARICNVLKKARACHSEKRSDEESVLPLTPRSFATLGMTEESESNLVRQLIRFPEIIEDTAQDHQTQRLPAYALELANFFHRFYENCRIIDQDGKVDKNRVALLEATKVVLKNVLGLMGVSAPEKM